MSFASWYKNQYSVCLYRQIKFPCTVMRKTVFTYYNTIIIHRRSRDRILKSFSAQNLIFQILAIYYVYSFYFNYLYISNNFRCESYTWIIILIEYEWSLSGAKQVDRFHWFHDDISYFRGTKRQNCTNN